LWRGADGARANTRRPTGADAEAAVQALMNLVAGGFGEG